jgi:hypothetical protein
MSSEGPTDPIRHDALLCDSSSVRKHRRGSQSVFVARRSETVIARIQTNQHAERGGLDSVPNIFEDQRATNFPRNDIRGCNCLVEVRADLARSMRGSDERVPDIVVLVLVWPLAI